MVLKMYWFSGRWLYYHLIHIFASWCLYSSRSHSVYGSNILITPFTGEGSHYYVAAAIGEAMVNRGHNVTFLLSDIFRGTSNTVNQQSKLFNYHYYPSYISMGQFHDLLDGFTSAGLKGEFMSSAMSNMSWHTDAMAKECNFLLDSTTKSSPLQDANFSVAVMDFALPCPIAQHLKVPYVILSPILAIPSAYLLANRNEVNPAYMSEMMMAYDHKMTYSERLVNTICMMMFTLITNVVVQPRMDELQMNYNLPVDTSLMFTDAEMWLINSHYALDFPRSLLPNTKFVGGLTTKPSLSVNKEWEEYLQSAGDDGVVIFSMGSYATGIDESIAAMFAGAFAQIPQKVIWKLNGKPSTSIPPNVKIVDWMPQNDLLGHPQIKAFVYHCGVNGVFEALYHGVPMVAIPLFGDQADNAQRVVSRGWGVKVDITTLTSDQLAHAIRTVISEPSYKSNATRLSAILRDSPRTPPELAADWLEYVIRHGGAKHLRSAALDLNLFQYLLLDVISMLLIVFITIVIIAICCCKLCFRGCARVCRRTRKVKGE